MLMRFWLMLLVVGACGEIVSAQDSELTVAGIAIARPNPDSQFGESLSRYRQAGLELDVYFHLPGKTVLSLDNKKSELSLTADDGTELPLREGFDGLLELELNEEPESGILRLRSEQIPAKGTTALKVKGQVVLMIGEAQKTDEVALSVKQDAKVKIGSVDAHISELSEVDYEPFKQSLTLESKQPFDTIKSIEFVDAAGKVVESEGAGSGSFGFGDDYTYSHSYNVASSAKQLKLRVTYFTKSVALKLPVDLTVGLGL